MSDFWRSKKTVAKKPHRCIACWQRIAIGETYFRDVGMFEGDFQNQAWHPECQAVFQKEADEAQDYTIYPGEHPRPEKPITP